MTGRYRWQILAGAVACLAQAGCQNLPFVAPAVGPNAAAVSAAGGELPAGEKARACLTTAEVMEKGGKIPEAIHLYEQARRADPKLSVERRLAVLHDRQGEFAKAQHEYDAALARAPKDADLLNDVGYSNYCRGRFDDAEKYLKLALAADPKHGRAWVNLGMTLAQRERYDEAAEAFHKVVTPAQAQCNLAFLFTAQGKRAEAMAAYRRALTAEPELRIARLALEKLEKNETAGAAVAARHEGPTAARAKGDTAAPAATTGFVIVQPDEDEPITVGPSGHTPPARIDEAVQPRSALPEQRSGEWHDLPGVPWQPRG